MKKFWKSIKEKYHKALGEPKDEGETGCIKEIVWNIDEIFSETEVNRRDFLKISGYSLTAATLAASCEAPVNKAIPFLIKPEEVMSGVANYYASSFIDGSDYCSILVKTREGRPIKIEGNVLSSITKGGTNARVQASVLSLYDTERLKEPLHKKNPTTWGNIDENIIPLLQSFNSQGKRIVILSSTTISPSTKNVYEDFMKAYPNTRVVCYDAISASAMLSANKISFGHQAIPSYKFDKAEIIISFGADFLGTWLSPIEFTKQYVLNRKLDNKKTMSRHIQFESGMSLTGSNADERFSVKPSEEGIVLINLYNELLKLSGTGVYDISKSPVDIKLIASELWANKGKSIVVSGTNDRNVQVVTNAINIILDNYGKTIDLNTPLYFKQGIDEEMTSLVNDMLEGNIDALIINNVNPAYDYPESDKFIKGLKNVKLSVSMSGTLDETSSLVNYICPDNHFLESWNDAEPKKGYYSLCQPTINRLFNTRASQESLLKWIGREIDFHDYIQEYWENNIYTQQDEYNDNEFGFRQFWINSLQNGVFEIAANIESEIQHNFNVNIIQQSIDEIIKQTTQTEDIELHLSESISLGNGKHANNPWLQELPDPISKVCWDNYASMSPRNGIEMKVNNGDVITIFSGSREFELPVLLQVGQAYNTISIHLGYGRTHSGKAGNNVGVNAFQMAEIRNGSIHYIKKAVKVNKADKKHLLALTQTHNSMEGRPIVRETTLDKYLKNPSSGNEVHVEVEKKLVSLYKKPVHVGYHWSLSIDLNACIGCGACIIACQAENNIPVVGKEEVRKRRIMHWIRIDRYYSNSIDDPQVYHQPIMCQHCDNAPCENVCPVAATMHSDDGLNHMTYNRCIGTRYCMNNCPYKVRHFNWYAYSNNNKFDFHMNSDLGRMVLNPDVVVRSRGVAEKCSLCVQRIQEMKVKAKLENRLLLDEEITPACLQSCPADAIVFGNRNDENSVISKKFADKRNYHLLEEIHSLPSVGYLVKVRNKSNI
jgi:molybdopterin-containing oxidoreductase family iron-sulfur binding subunit